MRQKSFIFYDNLLENNSPLKKMKKLHFSMADF